jgi:flagella basal body P-ring formation protein FlgA
MDWRQDSAPYTASMTFSLCASFFRNIWRLVLATGALVWVSTQAAAATPPNTAEVAQGIVDQVEQYLVEAVAGQFDGEPIIHVITPTAVQALAHCDAFQVYLPSGRKIRTNTTVAVRCQHQDSSPLYVRANVEVQGTYYVASHTIGINQAITDDMIEARSGDLLRADAHALTPPQQLVGRFTTQRILAGQPIRMSATRSAQAIQRGDSVRVEARGPGLYISNQGEALTTADIGGSIDVRMPNAKVIRGIVAGSGIVFVTF